MTVYCKKCTCLINCRWISWCFLFFCCACDLPGERRIWRIQMSNPQWEDTSCRWSFWQMANLCKFYIFLLTSTIRLIVSDVDLLLSHIPFTLMFPHLLQTSEISPDADACFYWCWRRGFHPFILLPSHFLKHGGDVWPLAASQISQQVDTMTVTVQKPSGATLSGFGGGHAAVLVSLEYFVEARNRFTLNNGMSNMRNHEDIPWRKGTTNWTSWMMYVTCRSES